MEEEKNMGTAYITSVPILPNIEKGKKKSM
jgi:hypothetical protein